MLTIEQLAPMRCPSCRAGELVPAANDSEAVICKTCDATYPHALGITDFVSRSDTIGAGSATDAAQAHYWEEEEIYRPYDHVVAMGFARQRAEYVRRTVPFSEICTALDVGSGNGMSTHCLQDDLDVIYSLDYSKHLLQESPARVRLRADAYRLPFRDKSVDLVYSWELLHHVHEPWTVLAEMKRVARRYIFFFEPNRYNPAQVVFALLSKHNRACLRNTRAYFHRQVDKAGLELIKHETVGWFTPNVPPVWLFHILRLLPFRVPLIGLSHFFFLKPPRESTT